MSQQALQAIERAIAALTVEVIERQLVDDAGKRMVITAPEVPLLQRSIGLDLSWIERSLSGRGKTLLSATHEAIDEALLALEEARKLLAGDAR